MALLLFGNLLKMEIQEIMSTCIPTWCYNIVDDASLLKNTISICTIYLPLTITLNNIINMYSRKCILHKIHSIIIKINFWSNEIITYDLQFLLSKNAIFLIWQISFAIKDIKGVFDASHYFNALLITFFFNAASKMILHQNKELKSAKIYF